LEVLILPYSIGQPIPQTQIGGNSTKSAPFVTPDGWVYFQGTDDRLLKVFNDGSQLTWLNNFIKSSPFVTPDGWVYFQGTDNRLLKVFNDGTGGAPVGIGGANTTDSAPFVTPDGWVYFRGHDDNKLWKVFNDGSGLTWLQNFTKSTPFVTPDGWVYFQGTDNRLLKVFNDGTGGTPIGIGGGNTTDSAPFVTPDGWVYFRGHSDNKLWKVFNDGSGLTWLNNFTNSTPFVAPDGWVYFQSLDNELSRVFNNGAGGAPIGNASTASTPFVVLDPTDPGGRAWVYFQGIDGKLWKVFSDGTRQSQIGGNTTASAPFVTPDGWVYFQGTDNRLWKVFKDNDRICFVTTRNGVLPSGPGDAPSPGQNPFNLVCEQPPAAVAAFVAVIIAGLAAIAAGGFSLVDTLMGVALAAIAAIPGGPILDGILLGISAGVALSGAVLAAIGTEAAAAAIAILVPLLDPTKTIGDYLATVENLLSLDGLFDTAACIVNQILGSFQSPGSHTDLSYKIMDTWDYNMQCYKALSIEVAFDADDASDPKQGPRYLGYVHRVFDLIQGFASQNKLVGAYISLRYCAGSEALLAIEQWPHTVCIEISALGGLDHDLEVLNAFEREALNFAGTVHWGQLNYRTRPDIEATFAGKIDLWRATLVQVSANGSTATFDNDFCVQRGLEPA
jgi:hypothetical protein